MFKKYLGLPILVSDAMLWGVWANSAPRVFGANPVNTAFFSLMMMLSILFSGSGIYYSAKFYRKYRFETPPKPIPFSSVETPWPEQKVSPNVQTEIAKILSG